jgi:hypothetical protein
VSSLSATLEHYPRPEEWVGWRSVPVLELVEREMLGWTVRVWNAEYKITGVDLRWVDDAQRNGMVTLYGGPCGPDYLWHGSSVWVYEP